MILGKNILHLSVELKVVAIGGTLVFLIVVLDEVWGLSAKIRLTGQLLSVGILYN
jgi:hypothetical protein